jgi:hypothetical protein
MSPTVLRARSPLSISILTVTLAATLLAGCSSAATDTGSPGTASSAAPPSTVAPATASEPASAPASEPAASSAAPASEAVMSEEPTGVPTDIDPCQLVTSDEASTLAGAQFGAGKEDTTEGNGRTCTYGSGTLNVFTVVVGEAPDAATAQAEKADFKAQLEKAVPKGVKVTELPDFADGAAIFGGSATVGGQKISASSIAVLKGTTFFAFSDVKLGGDAPSDDALQAQAQTCLGRIP